MELHVLVEPAHNPARARYKGSNGDLDTWICSSQCPESNEPSFRG